jgi:predicted GIY-YIG superfamily endonuclease
MSDPAFMRAAERASQSLQARTRGKPGAAHSVYVILLHNVKRRNLWGLYVGQTSRDPDLRFDQHKSGFRASSAARRFGICLLPALVAHLNPLSREESIELEALLADAFRAAGVTWVEGGH